MKKLKVDPGKLPHKGYFTIALYLIAIAMLVYALFRGEAESILRKAVNICLECIGIG